MKASRLPGVCTDLLVFLLAAEQNRKQSTHLGLTGTEYSAPPLIPSVLDMWGSEEVVSKVF